VYVKHIIYCMGATCFNPFRVIIRPSLESSQWMLRTFWDPNMYAAFYNKWCVWRILLLSFSIWNQFSCWL